MSLLFDNACAAFSLADATRCRRESAALDPVDADPVQIDSIVARARHVDALADGEGIHLPLHEQDSPALTDEYVTYVDDDLRGELFLFGPEDDREHAPVEEVARSAFGRRLRFWTSEYVPNSYPDYYRSPVGVVEESADVVAEDFFEELIAYVDREEAAARDRADAGTSADATPAACVSTADVDGGRRFRLEFEAEAVQGADDPEGVVRHDLGIHSGNEVLIDGGDGRVDTREGSGERASTAAPDAFPIRARVTDVVRDSVWIEVDWREQGIDTSERLPAERHLEHGDLAVEQLLNRVPYDRKREAIERVSRQERWADVLTGRRELTFDDTAAAESTPFDTDLNQEQQLAVEHALRADDLFCIHGPPGTGKTRTLLEVVRRSVAAGRSVLVCADSNQAVDNVLVGSSTPDEPDPRSLHAYGQHGADEFVVRRHNARRSSRELVRDRYAGTERSSDVVVSTNGSAAALERTFDLAVIDEATQATCASSCVPLQHAECVVLAGDHRQLPPFSRTESPPAGSAGMSLFEHLYASGGLYEGVGVQLRRQYRMDSTIAHLPNREFYDMTLEAGRTVESLPGYPPIEGYDMGGDVVREGTSYANPTEARVVARVVDGLLEDTDLAAEDVGVITPYTAQVRAVRDALPDRAADATVDTVDAFQGSERDAIVVSFVRSNADGRAGFLHRPEDGPRRLNVAITRAARYCALVGDWLTLTDGPAAEEETESDASASCADLYGSIHDFLRETGRMNDVDTALLA